MMFVCSEVLNHRVAANWSKLRTNSHLFFSSERGSESKATTDFGLDFLYSPAQEIARFGPLCRSLGAHLDGQWIHRLRRVLVEVSAPLNGKQTVP
jgi:hypothetical protein